MPRRLRKTLPMRATLAIVSLIPFIGETATAPKAFDKKGKRGFIFGKRVRFYYHTSFGVRNVLMM
jgi:hypothetical protein